MVDGGETKVVFEDRDERYINPKYKNFLTFLDDGDRFFHLSEKDGFNHLYLYSLSKGFLNQVTQGEYEVVKVVGIKMKLFSIFQQRFLL